MWCILVRLPRMKFTVWWSGLQRMNTKKSPFQADDLREMLDLPVEVGRLEGRMSDASYFDHVVYAPSPSSSRHSTRTSTATAPPPRGRTMSGLISISLILVR